MSKEIYISSTPHETRLAIVENDCLTEIYYERENEYTLAGSIYNGKVTRVLPGMQSSFVDIGLERDAFLYITDFMEEAGDSADFEASANSGDHARARRSRSRAIARKAAPTVGIAADVTAAIANRSPRPSRPTPTCSPKPFPAWSRRARPVTTSAVSAQAIGGADATAATVTRTPTARSAARVRTPPHPARKSSKPPFSP